MKTICWVLEKHPQRSIINLIYDLWFLSSKVLSSIFTRVVSLHLSSFSIFLWNLHKTKLTRLLQKRFMWSCIFLDLRIIYLHQKKCARALKYLKTKITKKYREIRKVLGLWDCITLFLFSSSKFKKIKQNENETKRYRTWNSNEVLCIVFTILHQKMDLYQPARSRDLPQTPSNVPFSRWIKQTTIFSGFKTIWLRKRYRESPKLKTHHNFFPFSTTAFKLKPTCYLSFTWFTYKQSFMIYIFIVIEI